MPKRLISPPVMVDELVIYPNAWGPFLKGSCHLTCSDLGKLHRFALKIGLRREWFQDGRVPHYDLTSGKRFQALNSGAIFVGMMEQARRRHAK